MGAVEIAAALSASRKAVRLYPPEHPTHREALRDLIAAVTEAVDVRPLVLNLRDGRLYEGSDVITGASPATRALVEAMEQRRVESLTFHMGFNETDGTGVSEVLSLKPTPDLQVQVELEDRGVRAVTVSELEDNTAKEAEERDRRREADRAQYRHVLGALKLVVERLEAGEVVEAVEVGRAIAPVIERVTEEPEAILALALMTGHGEAYRFHAASVMLYSLVLGHAVGMDDQDLLELGLGALLHDIGRVVPIGTGEPADDGAHPIAGGQLLGLVHDEDFVPIITAFEHHMGVDGSGWPEREAAYVAHPYSRIVAIANRYDNLLRQTTGDRVRPDVAAAQILRESAGGPLDHLLARLFVHAIGVVPIGATVRLSDHSVGMVEAPGENAIRPRVRVILAPDGTHIRPSIAIELADDEREIVEVLDGTLLDIQASEYL